eukprot:Hpha_TRINITY_DN8793_c0_g1::TRINITY_DN8793_c0_g1_i1::g.45111::m.45111
MRGARLLREPLSPPTHPTHSNRPGSAWAVVTVDPVTQPRRPPRPQSAGGSALAARRRPQGPAYVGPTHLGPRPGGQKAQARAARAQVLKGQISEMESLRDHAGQLRDTFDLALEELLAHTDQAEKELRGFQKEANSVRAEIAEMKRKGPQYRGSGTRARSRGEAGRIREAAAPAIESDHSDAPPSLRSMSSAERARS